MNHDQPAPLDPRVELAHDRTGMAAYRTALALERTTLAWIRTTLAMAGFGLSLVAFFRGFEEQLPRLRDSSVRQATIQMGTSLAVLGIVGTVLAGASHWRALGQLRRGEAPNLSRWPLSLVVAALAGILGFAAIWVLLD